MKNKKLIYLAALLSASVMVCGCGNSNNTPSAPAVNETGQSDSSNTNSNSKDTTSTGNVQAVTLEEASKAYGTKDLTETWDEKESTTVECDGTTVKITGNGVKEENGIITITAAGTYVFSGELSEGQIVVNAGEKDDVQIVLNGFTLACSTSSAINGMQSDKMIITLAKGTVNTLSDGSAYSEQDDKSEPDACIFSKDGITINGEGTLNVSGKYNHGIHSKDDLKIVNGIINVEAAADGIKGKDSVRITGGTISIIAGEDGIQSNEDSDADKGYVRIDGGTLDINAGKQGIQAQTVLQVNDGTINVNKSYEGFEAPAIEINGGESKVTASDDGFNAAVAQTNEDSTDVDASDAANQAGGRDNKGPGGAASMAYDSNLTITINGGKTTVVASGDGIDSNGDIFMNGGELYVSGPESDGDGALDYNGSFIIKGGTLVAAGSTGMAQSISESSTQYGVLYGYSSTQTSGTEISMKDSSGNIIASYTPEHAYGCVLISTPKCIENSSYTLYGNDSEIEEITFSQIAQTAGTETGHMGGGQMGGGQMAGGPMGDGDRGHR